MDLKEISILGTNVEHHWYYASKAKAMRRTLGEISASKILDVGAGSGFFSRHLLKYTKAKEAWCVDISYTEDSNESELGKQINYRRSVSAIDADLILLMDVIEHVDDDIGFLKEYIDKVPQGSQFLITVPAFEFLWSGHDDFLGHKRRYTLKQLDAVVAQAGLTVKHSCYYFGLVFPIAAFIRLIQKINFGKKSKKSQLTNHHPTVNKILTFICNAELPFTGLNRVGGLTVCCLAIKE